MADSVAVFAGRENVPHLDRAFHRGRLTRTAALVQSLIRQGAQSVTDLGCGDGGLLSLLKGARVWGYDIREASVREAREGCDVRRGDITRPETLEIGDVVVLTETLEHLDEPGSLLTALRRRARFVVASSPVKERPWKRLEPLHVWAWDTRGYRDLLARSGWTAVHQESRGAFQIIVAK